MILIYLLLQAAFSSWRLATFVILTVPMAVSGSVLAITATGGELTLGAAVGMLAVFGLATRGAVLMVRSFQRRERQGEAFDQDLVASESMRLVVPAVISALAIAAAMLPLAVAGSRAGLELVAPMAIAVLGGLVTTLLFTVFVLPALYLRWGYVAEPDTSADDLFSTDVPVATGAGG